MLSVERWKCSEIRTIDDDGSSVDTEAAAKAGDYGAVSVAAALLD